MQMQAEEINLNDVTTAEKEMQKTEEKKAEKAEKVEKVEKESAKKHSTGFICVHNISSTCSPKGASGVCRLAGQWLRIFCGQ